MTGRRDTQEDTCDVQLEILSHTRPPEKNPTTRQDAPNKEKDHIQTETNQNNRQDPIGYAEDDVNKEEMDKSRRRHQEREDNGEKKHREGGEGNQKSEVPRTKGIDMTSSHKTRTRTTNHAA